MFVLFCSPCAFCGLIRCISPLFLVVCLPPRSPRSTQPGQRSRLQESMAEENVGLWARRCALSSTASFLWYRCCFVGQAFDCAARDMTSRRARGSAIKQIPHTKTIIAPTACSWMRSYCYVLTLNTEHLKTYLLLGGNQTIFNIFSVNDQAYLCRKNSPAQPMASQTAR